MEPKAPTRLCSCVECVPDIPEPAAARPVPRYTAGATLPRQVPRHEAAAILRAWRGAGGVARWPVAYGRHYEPRRPGLARLDILDLT
jgi:hypothetical protein